MNVLQSLSLSGFLSAILPAFLAVMLTGATNASAMIGEGRELHPSKANVAEPRTDVSQVVCDVAPMLNLAEERYHNVTVDEIEKLIPIYEKVCQLAADEDSIDPDVFARDVENLYSAQIRVVAGEDAAYFVEVRAAFMELLAQAYRALVELDVAARLYDVQSGIAWLRQLALSERCPAEVSIARSVLFDAGEALGNDPDLLVVEQKKFEVSLDNFIAEYRRTGELDGQIMDAMVGQANSLELITTRIVDLYDALRTNHSLIDTYAIGTTCPMMASGR